METNEELIKNFIEYRKANSWVESTSKNDKYALIRLCKFTNNKPLRKINKSLYFLLTFYRFYSKNLP